MEEEIRLEARPNGTYTLVSGGRPLVHGIDPNLACRLAFALDGDIDLIVMPHPHHRQSGK
ncbi:hypothetical protein [Methylobacterium nodulans]|uniref:Uncharacterized protein n=1 Tax=Methylobacterium nodulans (strain LMG 21967 / CNCM I-2342 / ORS 2060) TaxID=460265 RepID=B8II81_METNO|nr:hypothetical protein [Methylobacterium nodulans]ACL57950.1 hypothetical protein Mnod_3007 [Methylobacterium nodulans ORS 2060]